MTSISWNTRLSVLFIKFFVAICDIITLPVFFIIDKPWNTWKYQKKIWAKLEDENNPYSSYIRQDSDGSQEKTFESTEVLTIDQSFQNAVSKFGTQPCYGTRQTIREEEETSPTGKVFKKLILGDYKWISFEDASKRVHNISQGLLSIGIRSKEPVVLFAETRLEWTLAAQACLKINVPVVTLYPTLGTEGLIHCINETDVSCIITSAELKQKLQEILPAVPKVINVIYMESKKELSLDNAPAGVKILPFSKLEEIGKQAKDVTFSPPSLDDLAIIMYTSGSTGIPKGVMMTHRNLSTSLKDLGKILNNSHSITLKNDDVYIAYLPSAHIFELASEFIMFILGVRVGFSSPHTLTDFSTAIKRGEIGDLKALKPTVLTAVPLMLDRIRNSILHLAGQDGSFSREIFNFAIDYKAFWIQHGFSTPFLNRLLLKTYKDFMGGHLRYVVSGGAPLSADTQSFIRVCLSVDSTQGYGLTETTCCNTISDLKDVSNGTVGAPLTTCKLRLVDWKDGHYYVTDKPNPRGEVVIGGDFVSAGYFKNDELTRQVFESHNGERWFYTGDIGEVLPNGLLKIIDRKKDLVKLQFGEYVALGKVEAELKTCPIVENICVFGNGLHSYLVALVTPNPLRLKMVAEKLGKTSLTRSEMCSDPAITAEVADIIRDHSRKCHLFGSEIPRKIKLCNEEWTPESGLVTAAFKIRRKFIENHYKQIIDTLYAERDNSKTLS